MREIEHLDFVGAVELLADRAGIQLRYTTGGEGRDRQRRKRAGRGDGQGGRVVPRAAAARRPTPGRRATTCAAAGIAGDVARQLPARLGARRLGRAVPRRCGLPADVLRDTGLAFVNRRDRLQDSFRARVLFPIFTEHGDPVAFGGRVLPGSADPAKYKNSPETRDLRQVARRSTA